MMSEEKPASEALTWAVRLPNEEATNQLAKQLTEIAQAGDIITLTGDLGAGKSTFARSFIRAFAEDPKLEVPSPTFTLMQEYETKSGSVVHADLYRITDPFELDHLGWDEAIENAIALVEWPDRAGDYLSSDRLDIHFRLVPGLEGERVAILTATGPCAARLAELKSVRTIMERAGWGQAERQPIYGDASSRRYERLSRPDGQTAILMFSPPRPKAPESGRNKPYHVVARLSETVHAFVAVDRGLRALGFSAPVIYGQDLEKGILLVEDLGSEGVADASGPLPDRYGESVRLLARLHDAPVPEILPVSEGIEYQLPPYDIDAMMVEVSLLLEWYMPYRAERFVPQAGQQEFQKIWERLIKEVTSGPTTWALRDFHSPNLIWLKEREGIARVGLIDFQDAVMSHPAYDLASLLQDARVTVPTELELKLLSLYAQERCMRDPSFNLEALTRAYAILGAQRATKLFGLFVRLDRRDGKSAYLAHLPRIGDYLRRNLAHPVLSELRHWFETYLPQLVRQA